MSTAPWTSAVQPPRKQCHEKATDDYVVFASGCSGLVVLPKPGQEAALKARCQQKSRVITDGPLNRIYALKLGFGEELQLDIFVARPAVKDLFQIVPGNFGSLLLCRTGSREHNIYLIEHAKQIGLTWKPTAGVFDADGYCLASETEDDVFRVNGKVYQVVNSTNWQTIDGARMNSVFKGGMVCDVYFFNRTTRWDEFSHQIFVLHHPEQKTATTRQSLKPFRAMRLGRTNYSGDELPVFDHGSAWTPVVAAAGTNTPAKQ